MDFEIFGSLGHHFAYKYVAIDHGAQQERDADFGIDAAAKEILVQWAQ